MAKKRQFRPVIAGTDVSRVITSLREYHGKHDSPMFAVLADRLEKSWVKWRDKEKRDGR